VECLFSLQYPPCPVFLVASGTELVPTSMMAAPFLIHDRFTMCAEPAAAITMSASL